MVNTDKKESFVFYRSFFDAIEEMPKKYQLAIYRAIAEYALDNKEPTLCGASSALWKSFRPQIDSSAKRYMNAKKGAKDGQKGAEYGRLGGRPKKTQEGEKKPPLRGIGENPLLSENQNPLNVNDNDNVNVNVNVNVDADANDNDNAPQDGAVSQSGSTPTYQDIMKECREQGYRVSIASKFFMFYDKSQWKTKEGEPVRDWQKMLRIWNDNEREDDSSQKRKRKNSFDFSDQRSYSNDELEAALLERG